ncbi:hypothetical protein CH296_11900 [Rhodococcus sp. 14-2496-1d]|nr:hypothetical protein CH256_01010 [Rhodococcus sp. 05-2254-6]OZF33312.1 hypothetical protein CH296_11900 [Rhodococcus sp. 14-2496-1d]
MLLHCLSWHIDEQLPHVRPECEQVRVKGVVDDHITRMHREASLGVIEEPRSLHEEGSENGLFGVVPHQIRSAFDDVRVAIDVGQLEIVDLEVRFLRHQALDGIGPASQSHEGLSVVVLPVFEPVRGCDIVCADRTHSGELTRRHDTSTM